MNSKRVVVCTEIVNTSWRWIAHHFSNDDIDWEFCRAQVSGKSLLTILFRGWAGGCAAVKARNADVLVSQGPYIAFYCAFFMWLFRVKTPHIVYSFNFAVLPTGLALKRMQWLFRKIDCIVVSSTMERTLYANYFGIPLDQIEFVRWGVSEPSFELKSPVIDGSYVSSVGGNARDYKTFMAAMAALPEIQAIAVMRPHNLEGLVVPGNVRVLTNTSKDEALSIIKNSTFTVLPLVGSDTPCGHVTIVASMYMGVPCVVTDSTGVVDYLEDNRTGLICEPKSIESLSGLIEKLWLDKSLCNYISTEAENFVRHDCTELNYVKHLKSILDLRENGAN